MICYLFVSSWRFLSAKTRFRADENQLQNMRGAWQRKALNFTRYRIIFWKVEILPTHKVTKLVAAFFYHSQETKKNNNNNNRINDCKLSSPLPRFLPNGNETERIQPPLQQYKHANLKPTNPEEKIATYVEQKKKTPDENQPLLGNLLSPPPGWAVENHD